MCEPLTIAALAAAAIGTTATVIGQQEAASAQRRTISDALQYQQQLQQQRGKAADAVIAKSGPQQLTQKVDEQKNVAAGADANSSALLDQLASGPGTSGSYAGVTTGAARDAATAGQNLATTQGFQQSLLERNRSLAGLAANQNVIDYSGNAALQMLPQQLEQAGNEGAGLRLAGGIASGIGGGALNASMFRQPAAGSSASGLAATQAGGTSAANAFLANGGLDGPTADQAPAADEEPTSSNLKRPALKPKSALLAAAYAKKKRAPYASA